MKFKEFLVALWASTLIGTTGYLVFAGRFGAWGASLFILAGGGFLLLALNVDVVSSFTASMGEQAQFRVEMNQIKEEVFAKTEYVRNLGEEVARFAAHNVATSNRFVGDDHQEQMLLERERIRAMMKRLGSEPARIAEVLGQIDTMVVSDLKNNVVMEVGHIHKLDQKAYEHLLQEIRDRLASYNSPASHEQLVSFLKERKVYDASVEKALNRLDLFMVEKHL